MSIKKIHGNGTATCTCPACGKDFITEYKIFADNDNEFVKFLHGLYDKVVCDECDLRRMTLEAMQLEEKRKLELAEQMKERMELAGIPPRFIATQDPFVRTPAEWIYRNRNQSLLIGGETGTGKTSSACFVACVCALHDPAFTVKYYTRQTLVSEFVRAKTSDEKEGYFWDKIGSYDLLIIDEVVGKNGLGKLSDSSQGLFFELLDGVYNGNRKTKIWMLGNFFSGSINGLFDDPEPAKRRLKECFKSIWINETGGVIEGIEL